MNGPILFQGYWRIRFLNVGVFRYTFTANNVNPNTNSMPTIQIERGTGWEWIKDDRESIRKAIAKAHGWLSETTSPQPSKPLKPGTR